MAARVWALRRFRLFWAGDTISAAGGALSAVAVPLLAIGTLHASDTFVGVLRAAQTLPFLLLAVPIGLLADRVSRRRLLLAADAVRFPLTAVIALAGASLPLGGLVTLVFTIGIATIAYEVAYLSVLPELVATPAHLPAANRAVESAHAGAILLGPAVGGALVAALSAPAVIALDALSFAVGAALTALNRWDRHPHQPPPPTMSPDGAAPARSAGGAGAGGVAAGGAVAGGAVAGGGAAGGAAAGGVAAGGAAAGERALTAGWNWLRRDRYVRPLTLYLAANNVGAQAFQTALLLFVVRVLDRGAAAVGLAVAATGGGFLLGALVSPGAAGRLGTGRVVIAASLIGASGIGAVAIAGGLPPVLLGSALAGAGSGLFNLHSIAIRQTVTPPRLLGRVNAVVKTISYGSATTGAFAGGVTAAAFGARAVIAASALVSAAATVCLLTPAIRTLTGTPAPRRGGPGVGARQTSDTPGDTALE